MREKVPACSTDVFVDPKMYLLYDNYDAAYRRGSIRVQYSQELKSMR